MNRRELLARIGRAAALLGVGAALTATSRYCTDALRPSSARFAVTSSCGPAGESEAIYEGEDRFACETVDEFTFPGGPALGLPDGGLLEVPEGDWPEGYEGDVLREGRFVLLGPVTIPGNGQRVHRTCRLTATAVAGAFAFGCEGPEAEAACAGTLTLLEPTP